MVRSVVSKVMWVGRATVFLVGHAVVLAVVLGLASAALAGTGVGAAFNLGKTNTVNRLSQLVGSTDNPMLRLTNKSAGADATALTLQVQPGHAPMRVNSSTQVTGLNADRVDGQDAAQIGVNGVETASQASASNSDSYKIATATCPEGKIALGSGYVLIGGKRGTFPNLQTDVVITYISPSSDSVQVAAYEEEPTTDNWSVTAVARCALAGTP
jgi:hypothetical protein